MNQYVKREQANGRKMLKLTCLEQKVEMYKNGLQRRRYLCFCMGR